MSIASFSRSGIRTETLEPRRLFNASPVYAPHSVVRGETLQQYAADFWKAIFAVPVYASDGKTIINPQFDGPLNPGDLVNVNHAFPSPNGKVTMLAGSFFGGTLTRSVTVPTGKPVFASIESDEWSNPDTADPPNFNTLPGHYTQAQLAAFAVAQTNTMTDLAVSLDGKAIANVPSHREPSLNFTYTQPAQFSIDQVFFGETVTGAIPAAADGFYLMFKPLSPGKHVLHLVGTSPDNSGDPPLLGPFSVDSTYTITVVPQKRHDKGNDDGPGKGCSPFSTKPVSDDDVDDLVDLKHAGHKS